MRSFGQLWPTLKRLLAYGSPWRWRKPLSVAVSPWRKPLSVAVMMLWIAAAAEVSGPLLISYFIDNMVARHHLPLGKVAGLAAASAAYVGLQFWRPPMWGYSFWRRVCITPSLYYLTGRPLAWFSPCARTSWMPPCASR
ncbi:ABC transporter protein IroC [Salmonella enterica subsp. enterica serovar Adelaide str. A4-669]|uniref:ABC transporter protein IroC n=1 Tax=Salmonella enterica subsp. enterica serovar Adelaide str. A4-669 TaxID=913063 RepID=A0A6C8GSP6_SALET|nr:ABC transporter protein IroC [Salmonella enterica subsp. enterica serovar Adelaide str. A4-669]